MVQYFTKKLDVSNAIFLILTNFFLLKCIQYTKINYKYTHKSKNAYGFTFVIFCKQMANTLVAFFLANLRVDISLHKIYDLIFGPIRTCTLYRIAISRITKKSNRTFMYLGTSEHLTVLHI